MEMLGVKELVVRPAEAEEKAPDALPPAELVQALASHKAREVALRSGPGDIVVAADTVVWLENRVFGKPKDEGEAAAMLRALSGRTHAVITGMALRTCGKTHTFSDTTEVDFKTLSEHEIRYYIEQYRPFDKAGAYGIQEWIGYVGITAIRGSYFNVMGLPVQKLYTELCDFLCSPA